MRLRMNCSGTGEMQRIPSEIRPFSVLILYEMMVNMFSSVDIGFDFEYNITTE